MKVEEYFAQSEYYFSESSSQMLQIDGMVMTHAANSFEKLCREYPEQFPDTPLYYAFIRHLLPGRETLVQVLKTHGTASIYCPPGSPKNMRQAMRSRLRNAALSMGKNIRTQHKGKFITGELVTREVRIKVRGNAVN